MPAPVATPPRRRAVPAVLGALLGTALGAVLGAALAVGALAVAALLGTEAHQLAYSVGGVRWPVGLVLALALTGVVAGLLRALGAPLGVRAAGAAGWLAAITAVLRSGPGQDVLVPANVRGYGWLLLGLAVLLAVLLLPGRDRHRARS